MVIDIQFYTHLSVCSLQNGRFAINSIIRLMDRSEMYTAESTAANKKYNHRIVAIRRCAI